MVMTKLLAQSTRRNRQCCRTVNHLSGLSRCNSSSLCDHFFYLVSLTFCTGEQGETWCHLQARRKICQGIP